MVRIIYDGTFYASTFLLTFFEEKTLEECNQTMINYIIRDYSEDGRTIEIPTCYGRIYRIRIVAVNGNNEYLCSEIITEDR